MTQTLSTSRQPLPKAWVERLLERMLMCFGKKFTDQWLMIDGDKMVEFWQHELSNMSGEELARGLAKMEGLDWPPSLPEFKKLCRPGIDSTVAYYEAVAGVQERQAGKAGKWSHPAVYWAAMPLTFDLMNQTYSQVKTRWETAFHEQMSKGEWEPIPEAMVLIGAPEKAQTKEEAAKALVGLKAAEAVKTPDDKIDHKRWARKILERAKRGDKTLTLVQIQFATEALSSSAAP